jgi:hypothetical protein
MPRECSRAGCVLVWPLLAAVVGAVMRVLLFVLFGMRIG